MLSSHTRQHSTDSKLEPLRETDSTLFEACDDSNGTKLERNYAGRGRLMLLGGVPVGLAWSAFRGSTRVKWSQPWLARLAELVVVGVQSSWARHASARNVATGVQAAKAARGNRYMVWLCARPTGTPSVRQGVVYLVVCTGFAESPLAVGFGPFRACNAPKTVLNVVACGERNCERCEGTIVGEEEAAIEN
jgi:hypothetical protein